MMQFIAHHEPVPLQGLRGPARTLVLEAVPDLEEKHCRYRSGFCETSRTKYQV